MEWAFVYGPPIVAVLVAVSGSALLALFVPVPNTSFWGRWAIAFLLILGLPTLAYLVRSKLKL
jgi:hypothetical protein